MQASLRRTLICFLIFGVSLLLLTSGLLGASQDLGRKSEVSSTQGGSSYSPLSAAQVLNSNNTQVNSTQNEIGESSTISSGVSSLNIQVTPPNATLSVGQIQNFVATVSNGSAPYSFTWRDESGNILGTQQTLSFQFAESLNTTTVLSVEVSDSAGNTGTDYVAVFYAYSGSAESSDTVNATASYTVMTVGQGEYQAVAFNGSIVYKSSNASYIINSCIQQVALNHGGTIFISAGNYYLSNSIVMQSSVDLIGEGFGTYLTFSSNLSQDVILDSIYDVTIANLQFTGSLSNDIGLVLENVSWIYIESCQWSYFQYPIYINSQLGNTVEFRDIGIFNSENGIVINGANQINFYNPHIAFPTLQTGTAGFLFTNLLNDPVAQPQSIKIYSGWILDADSCFK